MDSLQKPNRENSTCLPFWLYSCQRSWNGTFRKWHAAGFLYLYTRNKLERFLKCGGQSGGPPMFATLKQQVHKHFSMGQGKGKNSALQPHPQQRTSLANSTRHALLLSATFQFRSSVIALLQKVATGKTSLSTSPQYYKRTRQLGCFRCLPTQLAKLISWTLINKVTTKTISEDVEICRRPKKKVPL